MQIHSTTYSGIRGEDSKTESDRKVMRDPWPETEAAKGSLVGQRVLPCIWRDRQDDVDT
jgi:hypothetical protein